MSRKIRQFAIRPFLAELLRKHAGPRGGLFLGLDESAADKRFLVPVASRLVSQGIASSAGPLWDQLRRTASGQVVSVVGGSLSEWPGLPKAMAALRGYSVPDERVLSHLVVHLINHDRVCLVTADRGMGPAGMHRIAHEEIAPVLRGHPYLGVLVLAAVAPEDRRAFAKALEVRLTTRPVEAGFAWEDLPGHDAG